VSSVCGPKDATSVPSFRINGSDLGPEAALKQFRIAVQDVFSVELTSREDAVALDAVSWHLGNMMLGVFRGPP
jgi:hypothetical protein